MESKHAIHKKRIIELAKEYDYKYVRVAKELALELGKNYPGGALKEYCKKTIKEIFVKVSSKSETKANDYKQKFVLSAWNQENGQMMDIDKYCQHYSLPRKDISSYKLVSHTGTPYYNIVFKEIQNVEEFDFDAILSKYENFKPAKYKGNQNNPKVSDFDTLTYTDVHIGMDTDSTKNSMYPVDWSLNGIMDSYKIMIDKTIETQTSDTIVVDELGDFLDGFNGLTTRGGHKLPQLMTNEEAFDTALEFKIKMIDDLQKHYSKIIINNICNDNHAGSFGYFVNSSLKNFSDRVFKNVEVINHRQFINHYGIGKICFIITHGKDDVTLKFGFKPNLDSKGMEKIDQYCKQNNIYKDYDLIVFKKGDSHQCLFDMCTSDDFYYFNYHALSPSSQWVQNNFKKGRRGFVLEKWDKLNCTLTPIFIK